MFLYACYWSSHLRLLYEFNTFLILSFHTLNGKINNLYRTISSALVARRSNRNPLQLPFSTHYITPSNYHSLLITLPSPIFLWPSPVLFTPTVADTGCLNNKLDRYREEQVEWINDKRFIRKIIMKCNAIYNPSEEIAHISVSPHKPWTRRSPSDLCEVWLTN